jgi:hypothetical protein
VAYNLSLPAGAQLRLTGPVLAAYLIAALTAPAGISGADLLLPFQARLVGILVIAIGARYIWSGLG